MKTLFINEIKDILSHQDFREFIAWTTHANIKGVVQEGKYKIKEEDWNRFKKYKNLE